MALTTPDNIWTPDSGDDYALTPDLANTANTMQAALTKKANYGVGTTAEMNADLSRFPNGALWYNTTTSSEWRRVSGAWVNLGQFVDVAATSVQSMVMSTEVVMNYDSPLENPTGMWSAGAPNRITCQVAGVYQVTFFSSFASGSDSGSRIVVIRKNGSSFVSFAPNYGQRSTSEPNTVTMRLAAGDYVQAAQYQSSGSYLNTHPQSYPRLQAARVG